LELSIDPILLKQTGELQISIFCLDKKIKGIYARL